ncbi:MAG: MerR family transcriptional regulator [Rudaea sp.]
MKKSVTGLNIKAVSERTGVSLDTLRAWERRYGVPRPARVPGNRYRVYGEQDIADVLWIKRQVEAGVSPARASAMLQVGGRPVPPTAGPTEQPLEAMRGTLLAALVSADETGAQQILDEASALFSLPQVARDLIQPAMVEIGERWMKNEITVAQEHFASNLIRQRLLGVLQSQPPPPLTTPRLVAACPPAEQHEFGLLLFSLLARRGGWQVLYLGQRTPLAALTSSASPASLIVLSVTTVVGLASLIPLWVDRSRPAARLTLGGLLFKQVPLLREHIPGAFLGDDALEAVRALATGGTRETGWRPSSRSLNAALALQDERLRLADATLEQMQHGPAGAAVRRSLVEPTLFLVDAVSSALAFQVPELLDVQGAWIRDLLVWHGVDPQMIQGHLKSFVRAARRVLPVEQRRSLDPLIGRLLAAAGEGPQKDTAQTW